MRRRSIPIADLQVALAVDRRRVRVVARRALAAEGCKKTVSIALVDDARIRDLNRRFLGHDWATDVIAFPLDDAADDLLGEVVVSTETAIREAARRNSEAMDEVLLYVVHGILHLLGYDDHAAADRRAMRRREAEVITGTRTESFQQLR